jgi:hypothetical protein
VLSQDVGSWSRPSCSSKYAFSTGFRSQSIRDEKDKAKLILRDETLSPVVTQFLQHLQGWRPRVTNVSGGSAMSNNGYDESCSMLNLTARCLPEAFVPLQDRHDAGGDSDFRGTDAC